MARFYLYTIFILGVFQNQPTNITNHNVTVFNISRNILAETHSATQCNLTVGNFSLGKITAINIEAYNVTALNIKAYNLTVDNIEAYTNTLVTVTEANSMELDIAPVNITIVNVTASSIKAVNVTASNIAKINVMTSTNIPVNVTLFCVIPATQKWNLNAANNFSQGWFRVAVFTCFVQSILDETLELALTPSKLFHVKQYETLFKWLVLIILILVETTSSHVHKLSVLLQEIFSTIYLVRKS